MKNYLTLLLTAVTFSLFITSCGSATTEEDNLKAEESAKELEKIDYENVEMPDAGEETEAVTTDEEFDADAMLD